MTLDYNNKRHQELVKRYKEFRSQGKNFRKQNPKDQSELLHYHMAV